MPENDTNRTVVVHHGDSSSGLSGVVTALIVLLLIAIIGFFAYRSGIFGGSEHRIDVNINKPGIVLSV